ncbi:hypothetical protein EYZ11_000651 [Aspergillus tanneri]|uniref:Uncharacterized protein n=1 Tax=Aspergillus tanneri TaxID=1220188 RepID=A0A4S3JWH7_9EURO|nr:hypothetical protein EYZ11_000651 [Aspergillus tanneri]
MWYPELRIFDNMACVRRTVPSELAELSSWMLSLGPAHFDPPPLTGDTTPSGLLMGSSSVINHMTFDFYAETD